MSRVALVTGASRGIGAAIASRLADRGARVWALSRSEPGDDRLTWLQADLRDADALGRAAAALGAREGRLDLLVNNASILGPRRPLVEVEPEQWERVLAVNATGSFLVARAFWPLLLASEAPVVASISSSVGRRARAGWGPYAASKFALEGLCDVWADEIGALGCSISINPGGTATQMRAEAYPDEDPETLPSADEVGRAIAWLLGVVDASHNGARFDARDLFGRAPNQGPEAFRVDWRSGS